MNKNITRFKVKVSEVPEIPFAGTIDPVLFEAGYRHGLASNVLRDFRKSFRFGFRKAKIEQMEAEKKKAMKLYANVRSIK